MTKKKVLYVSTGRSTMLECIQKAIENKEIVLTNDVNIQQDYKAVIQAISENELDAVRYSAMYYRVFSDETTTQ